jgi:hypothetical protein
LACGSGISRDSSADFDVVYDTFRVNNIAASRFPKAFRRVYDEVHHDLLKLRGISANHRKTVGEKRVEHDMFRPGAYHWRAFD